MIQEKKKAGPVAGTDLRNTVLANTSEHIRLEALRVQYLAVIFDLSPSTAGTIAELALLEAR
ncbi:hypothetical protein [Bradyrhizobium sp. McL0616]|uniref:hypothetical protein n=1 Tax=Bradyrhizobium sp. McL0616 TaxID=3415674 RepID=UPI003CF2F9F0